MQYLITTTAFNCGQSRYNLVIDVFRIFSGKRYYQTVFRLCVLLLTFFYTSTTIAQNDIVVENQKQGNPASEWDINGAGSATIQGFATDISVNKGNTIRFKINTSASNYTIDIYRLGYYGGLGARKVGTGTITASLPQTQPAEIKDAATGLVDCGSWNESARWDVPADAVSGIYLAKLKRTDNNNASHITFIVRDDVSTSDLYFQTSDATWQAYNKYGGSSLYIGNTKYPGGHAVKISYNRPLLTRDGGGGGGEAEDGPFNAEYPMVRWLERNGFDVTYTTNVDADRYGTLIKNHKVFLSVGHDEYWSGAQRANVEAARNAGVHLAFFSGNEVYWKTRWENSIDGSGTPYRTLVCYKEGNQGENTCGEKCDPLPNVWTGLWRDGCDYAEADGCRPENALTGQISWAESTNPITVPGTYSKFRFWRNTAVANLTANQSINLSNGTLGYEWNYEQSNGKYPPGRIRLSQTTVAGNNHHLSLYRHSSGALVFGAGTVQWSWGLDNVHDRGSSVQDVKVQQATINLLADMGVQPGSIQSNLSKATAVNDNQPPSTIITSPKNGTVVKKGVEVVISGTGSESAGVVAGVEVSVDGGITWMPASGTTSWTYNWTPTSPGNYTIKSRGVDDIGNLETSSTSTNTVQVTTNAVVTTPPTVGPGGPILVVSSTNNPFTSYTAEVLRSEGFNAFANKDISVVTATELDKYHVVILGEMQLSTAQVTLFADWTNKGGTFIAFRPSTQLSGLLGLTPVGGNLRNQYLKVNTSSEQGKGIVDQTIQFHGAADLYNLNGATALATLYSNATTASAYPAVSINNVGENGGQAIAFTYDLMRSIIYTRQGNPEWAGQKRDGESGPIRSDDMFFGNASFDPQPDWIDLNKVAIPQADEQQRLLSNIIIKGTLDKMPLPRFWFLPSGHKAAVVMTGDDHGNAGTKARFNQYKSTSTSNTADAVADWKAIRATSYIFPGTNITNAQAMAYEADGFEIALHLNTNCSNFTPTSFQQDLSSQMSMLANQLPGLSSPSTNRTHCIAWSDWASAAKIEAANGIRLDVNYYYWPEAWVKNKSGMFTGSGMPMRFAELDGSMIDCYKVTTQMTDESGQAYPTFVNQLLDRALGTEGYYGVFCANMHTDEDNSAGSDAIISSAKSRQIPVITSKQMLTWLDGRNASLFESFNWDGNTLTFSIKAGAGARNIQAILPMEAVAVRLKTMTFNGGALNYKVIIIKGIEYAMFAAGTGSYTAAYTSTNCVPPTAELEAKVADCEANAVELNLKTAKGKAPYEVVVNNKTYSNVNIGESFAIIPAEQSIWSNTNVPEVPDANDKVSIEVGVKFTALQDGYITGIRFYKGSLNTGQHTGSLWNTSGTKIASAVFTNETNSGWQEVKFANPVAILANTTYVASYLSQGGGYSFTSNYFTNSNTSNLNLIAPKSIANDENGVYVYNGGFPSQSYNNANYWVDVLYKPNTYTFNLTSIKDAGECTAAGNISSATLTEKDLKPVQNTYYLDKDNDGFGNNSATKLSCSVPAGYVAQGNDCNDNDAAIYPGAPEICDNKDNDCDGSVDEDVRQTYYVDADGDGYGGSSKVTDCSAPAGYVLLNGDCNDGNPDIYPGAPEICDGVDNNCDGNIDEGCVVNTYYQDGDGDGYGDKSKSNTGVFAPKGYVANGNDCDDANPNIHPGAPEICDGVDNNCDGIIDENCANNTYYKDIDGDGYGSELDTKTSINLPEGYVLKGGDCDDNDPSIHPGAPEICDNKDNDCNGIVDDNVTTKKYYEDKDKDGFGTDEQTVNSCSAPVGFVEKGGDCNDNDGTIYPGAAEICDGKDNDCNGKTDENGVITYFVDNDGDGYGSDGIKLTGCTVPDGHSLIGGDCNDNSSAVHPLAIEICDGIDNDCDGLVDEDVKLRFYKDADGDGYGSSSVSVLACSAPVGYVSKDKDCNDNDKTINPGAIEICDGKDNNCNGVIDEGCAKITFYRDADGDGFGNSKVTVTGTSVPPLGYVTKSGDCNDGAKTCYPGAKELCDGLDNDCDGIIDEGLTQKTFYQDKDGDTWGNSNVKVSACAAPIGYVSRGGDCNDGAKTCYPGAKELCDGLDNDCDGIIDEGLTQKTFYQDKDGDTWGNSNVKVSACAAPIGYVSRGGDCNDGAKTCYPGAKELCDGLDNDCDGIIDEGLTQKTFYQDKDGDTWGNSNVKVSACAAPIGYVSRGGDCNDGAKTCYPGAKELCDGLDNDCDGIIDEGLTQKTFYQDKDGDTWGNSNVKVSACAAPKGYVSRGGDCNDANKAINPGVKELIGNKIDDNCNGMIDEASLTSNFRMSEEEIEKVEQAEEELEVIAMPNPSKNHFLVRIQSTNTKEKIYIRIFDEYGRMIEWMNTTPNGKTIPIGNNYRPGVYIIEAIQGTNKTLKKVIKISE